MFLLGDSIICYVERLIIHVVHLIIHDTHIMVCVYTTNDSRYSLLNASFSYCFRFRLHERQPMVWFLGKYRRMHKQLAIYDAKLQGGLQPVLIPLVRGLIIYYLQLQQDFYRITIKIVTEERVHFSSSDRNHYKI